MRTDRTWMGMLGLAMLASVMVGCGASQTASEEPGEQGGDDTCAGYRATDGCMDDENFAACRARVEECGSDVLVLESCPLQFACP